MGRLPGRLGPATHTRVRLVFIAAMQVKQGTKRRPGSQPERLFVGVFIVVGLFAEFLFRNNFADFVEGEAQRLGAFDEMEPLDYRSNYFVPTFRFDLLREGYTEGISSNKGSIEMFKVAGTAESFLQGVVP